MPPTEENPVPYYPDTHSAPKKKGLAWGWWILLVAVVAFIASRVFSGGENSTKGSHDNAGKAMPIPVSLASVTTEDFPIYLDGLGTVQAFNTVQVNARVSGLIQEIKFQEGQEVKAGDVLALIDPRTYQAQYDQALSKQHQDEAQLQSAQVLLARDQALLTKLVLDKETYDTQKYLVAQLTATVQADAANVEQQKTQLDWTQVTAPIAGRTGVRLIDVGNQVQVGGNNQGASNNAIVTINQIQPIDVAFTLPQQDLNQIREPMLARKPLEVIALDRNNQTILSKGTLSVIDNQIDTATATVKLKAVFANDDYKLWPGQFVNVRLLVGTASKAIVVPTEAVQLGPDGSYVYVVSAENKAVMRAVTPGPTENGMTLIESGLNAGEKVVTDGQYRLQPDALVTTAPPKGKAKSGKLKVEN